MKSFRELAEQSAELRRAKRKMPPPSNAKTERNAEIVWMRELGVPISHIARVHDITDVRVRAIVRRARSDAK
jgi:hypothetical protein